MRFRLVAALLGCLALACAIVSPAGAEAPRTPAAQDDAALIAAHKTFWSAYEAGDLWRMSQLWARDDDRISAVFPASATLSVGWGNVQESFRRTFAHNRNVKVDARLLRSAREGDVAWFVSAVRYEAVQTQTGQFVLLDRMFTTEVYKRQNGEWRLAHYHGHFPGFRTMTDDPATIILAPPPIERPDDPVWKLHERFTTAFSALDLGAMFELFSPQKSVTALQPTAPVPFFGPENVIASWKKTFGEVQALTIEPLQIVVEQSGSVAWVTELSQFHIAFKAKPDEIQHFHSVLTTYVLREEAGQWQIAHYHAHFGFGFEAHQH
ncbi:nuclear transport factor 2 family protein [Hansschlegelia beijingensis]|uniref:nuclear transport factor 2 family protein n=1 Tax=Hansschlegelia beijingensis TaxID=1133344 RepID=UPI00387EF266